MIASQLIAILREDYLYDVAEPYRWSDAFLYRSLLEAERQSASRWNLIFDNGQPVYGAKSVIGGLPVNQNGTQYFAETTLAQIPLLDGVSTYQFSTFITAIKAIFIENEQIQKCSEDELNRHNRHWRNLSGIGLRQIKGNTQIDDYCPTIGHHRPKTTIRGRSITITPYPSAKYDASFSQPDTPTANSIGDTWFNQTNSQLNVWDGTNWVYSPGAALGYLNFECYRLPLAVQIDGNYTFEIAEEHHRQLLWWVMYEAYMKKDSDGADAASYDPERAAYAIQMFEQYFGKPVSASVRANMLEENPSSEIRAHNYYNSGY